MSHSGCKEGSARASSFACVWVKADGPVFAEAVESTDTGGAAEVGAALEAATTKANGAENWAGPASRRRDSIGAPAVQASMDTDTQGTAQGTEERTPCEQTAI